MKDDEAEAVARLVRKGQPRSYVQAAQLLAEHVLDERRLAVVAAARDLARVFAAFDSASAEAVSQAHATAVYAAAQRVTDAVAVLGGG